MSARTQDPARTAVVVAGVRTPFARAGAALKGAAAADLATHVFREVLDRTGIDAGAIDETILGCAGPDAREANVARVAALRAGVPQSVPAVTVMRNCASGMEALLQADLRLRAGDGALFLVGGAESMSNYPLTMGPKLTAWFQRLGKARTALAKLRAIAGWRPSFLKPRIALLEGLTDPTTGLSMGRTAENVARQFAILRDEQDAFAVESHRRAAAARESGRFQVEIAPLSTPPEHGAFFAADDGIRVDQSLPALAKLKPVFDPKEGDVTVGNACQITDGAAALLVTSLAHARELGLEPLCAIRGAAVAGLDPRVMGLGPAHAIPAALDDAGVPFASIDRFEINEAFAAQVLGCVRALADTRFCVETLGRSAAVGEIPADRLNTNGGAIALGHPIAASGARIVLTLAHELQRRGERFGVASLCIGGGQGQAVVLENLR